MSIFTTIGTKVAVVTSKASVMLVKKAPTLLFIGGVTTTAGALISAIVATSKADACMDEFKENMDRIKENIELSNQKDNPEEFYPVADQKKDIQIIYAHMIKTMAKIYLPTFLLEITGIFMLCKSHTILSKRNASLAAAYAALAKSYSDYRKRVREQFGEQVENDIYNGYVTSTYTEKVTSENGVTTEVEKTKETYKPLSPFSFLISLEDNPWGMKDPYSILNQIDIITRSLNNRLEARIPIGNYKSFMTMNEIAEAYGESQRPEWATFVKYQDNKDITGALKMGITMDNAFIEGTPEWKFVNKITDGIWLTPNIEDNLCNNFHTQCVINSIMEKQTKHNALEGVM